MKKLLGIVIFSIFYLFAASDSFASEGTFELRSTDTNKYKCFAASLQMQNLNYKVILSCRNILFPVDETIFTYILWANPENGGKAIKVGSVGLGKGEYSVKPAFTSLFVTTEQNPNVKEPAGKVVMKGSIKPITFLDKEQTSVQNGNDTENNDIEEATPTPASENTSLRDRLITGFKRAGLASALALVAILGLVFVLTRPK